MMEFGVKCQKCDQIVNLEMFVKCPVCGTLNLNYEELFIQGRNGKDVMINCTYQYGLDNPYWQAAWYLKNRVTGRMLHFQPMITPSDKSLKVTVENIRKGLTDCPQCWGLIY